MAKKHFHYKEQSFQAQAVKSVVDIFKDLRFHKRKIITEQSNQMPGWALENTQLNLNPDDRQYINYNVKQVQQQN